jgi:hypothetical protein
MPDPDPEPPQESFIIAQGGGKGNQGKLLNGFQEAFVAVEILKLIKTLPAKTPGLAEIKAGALTLARAGGTKLSKAK